MRGIASQKHAAFLEAARDVGGRTPSRDTIDGHRQIGNARTEPHQLDQMLWPHVVGRTCRFRTRGVTHGIDDEEAGVAVFVHAEEARQLRILHIDDAQRLADHVLRQRRVEVDRDGIREDAAAIELDPEQLADFAVSAVGANQILRTNLTLDTARDVANRRGHSIGVLFDADDLVPFDHACTRLLRPRPQDRFETRLSDEQPPARTERLNAFIEAGNQAGQHLAGQRIHQDDGAFGLELLVRLLAHAVFDACRPEHLQRPHVEKRRTRHRRSAAQAFHRDRRDAMLCEEHRRRETHQASAGEQDGNIFDTGTRHGTTS